MRDITLMAIDDRQCQDVMKQLHPHWYANWRDRKGTIPELRAQLRSYSHPQPKEPHHEH